MRSLGPLEPHLAIALGVLAPLLAHLDEEEEMDRHLEDLHQLLAAVGADRLDGLAAGPQNDLLVGIAGDIDHLVDAVGAILLDGELEYEVEEFISHRFVGHNKLEYLVKWLDWGLEHNTWEPKANCANCPEKVSDYWARVQAQAGVRVTRGSKRVAPDSASVDEAPRRSKRARRAQNKTQRRHRLLLFCNRVYLCPKNPSGFQPRQYYY